MDTNFQLTDALDCGGHAEGEFLSADILIVDDEQTNVNLLAQLLENAGYTRVRSTTDPRETFSLFVDAEPDLILLDLMMPEMSGFDVMERLKFLIPRGMFLPILILTADVTAATRRNALAGLATDFLTKPFDTTEVLLRIRNLLNTRQLHLQLRAQNETLEARVRARTTALDQSQAEVLERLALAAEFRDDDTGQHTHRVGSIAAALAERAGFDEARVQLLRRAAPLHDVGKIGISDLILLKPGKLTEEEFATMKTHAAIGASLLSGGNSELVMLAESIAGSHHERWDGRGYPAGLAGDAIPIEGRIVAIADVFDALTHERPYKKPWPVPDAVEEIRQAAGKQFDPTLVELFLQLPHETFV